MKRTITVEVVEVRKEGISASNRAWTLYNITDTNGKRYSTFESLQEGRTYDVDVSMEPSRTINPKTGKPYVNAKIDRVYPAKRSEQYGPEATVDPDEKLEARIASLEKRVAALEYDQPSPEKDADLPEIE